MFPTMHMASTIWSDGVILIVGSKGQVHVQESWNVWFHVTSSKSMLICLLIKPPPPGPTWPTSSHLVTLVAYTHRHRPLKYLDGRLSTVSVGTVWRVLSQYCQHAWLLSLLLTIGLNQQPVNSVMLAVPGVTSKHIRVLFRPAYGTLGSLMIVASFELVLKISGGSKP